MNNLRSRSFAASVAALLTVFSASHAAGQQPVPETAATLLERLRANPELLARFADRVRDHALLGCYRLEYANWSQGVAVEGFIPPRTLQLDTLPVIVPGGYAYTVSYRIHPTSSPGGFFRSGSWQPTDERHARVVWTDTGWDGFELEIELQDDIISGEATKFAGHLQQRATSSRVTGSRVPCR